MVKRIQELFKQIFLSLWNSGGLVGRFIALPIGFVFIIILILLYLFKLTFTWAYKLLKLFLDEFIYFTNKCASAANDATEILDEFIEHRVYFYIKKIWSRIVDEEFLETKTALSKSWFWRLMNFSLQTAFWALSAILLFLITFSGVIYSVSTFFIDDFSVDFRISIILKFLVFTPILIRMIRLRTFNILNLDFWESERLPTINFKKRHLLYVVILLVSAVMMNFAIQKKLINFNFWRTDKSPTEEVIETSDSEIDYSDSKPEETIKKPELPEIDIDEDEELSTDDESESNEVIDNFEEKNRIIVEKYLRAIDKKDWSTLRSMFAKENVNFYGNEFDSTDLEKFLKRIWKSVKSEENKLLPETLKITNTSNGNKINFTVEYSGTYTNGKSKKLKPKYEIQINKNGKITFVSS